MIKQDNIKSSDDYWQKEAESFIANYKYSLFSFRFIARRFLHKRTKFVYNLTDVSKQDQLLDVGCGSGIHMEIFASQVAKVVGIDYSLDMLELCKRRLNTISISNYKLFCCDANLLGVVQNSFDCVISIGLFDYIKDVRAVLLEFYSVLKDDGYVIFSIPKQPSIFSFFRTGFGLAIRENIFKLPPIVSAVSRVELENLLKSTGFQIKYLDSIWTTMWMVKANKKR